MISIRNASGFKGVFAHGRGWRACMRVPGRNIYLGTRATRKEASRLYMEAVEKYRRKS